MGKPVDVRQMQAEQMVEQRLVVRVKLVAVPPEPVAPFGGIEFVPRLTDRVGRHVASALPLLQEAPSCPRRSQAALTSILANQVLKFGLGQEPGRTQGKGGVGGCTGKSPSGGK